MQGLKPLLCFVGGGTDLKSYYSINDDEDGDISQGHCNECKEDRELTICELDEEGKVK